VYTVAAIQQLQFMAHVTLFRMLNILYSETGTFQTTCSVPIVAIFYSYLTPYFPGIQRRHLWNDGPIIIGITFVFTFHVRSISVARTLHVISFWFFITMLIHFCFSYSFWLHSHLYPNLSDHRGHLVIQTDSKFFVILFNQSLNAQFYKLCNTN